MAGRLAEEVSSVPNSSYQPSSIANVLGVVMISLLFVCVLVNIICKRVEYRQALDFVQFVGATQYLEIQYPPILM